jgi:hypothetical protein
MPKGSHLLIIIIYIILLLLLGQKGQILFTYYYYTGCAEPVLELSQIASVYIIIIYTIYELL